MSLVADLRNSQPLSIPRYYCHGMKENVLSHSLCGFCDASTTAYAAVVYLVMKTPEDIFTQFLACKTRVAPLQTITIPRLELLSALLLSRLMTTVHTALISSLPDLEMSCYTDSTVALHWIKGTSKEWKVFVQNRVSEIRQNTAPELWDHCPGITNPADLPSREMTLSGSSRWRFGPDWLKSDTTPTEIPKMPEKCSTELKTTCITVLNLATTLAEDNIGEIIECEKYSSFKWLVRITPQVLRAVRAFKD